MSVLTVENIYYSYTSRYQTVEAIRGLSSDFKSGKVYAIVGKSGCGKTTLLSLLAALDLPTKGTILFKGKATTELNRDSYRRKDVAVIYQAFNLFPLLNALENVTFPMELQKVPLATARERAKALLEYVGLSKQIYKQFPKMMSGGEQQRVAVARALASEAPVILADEPTGNLDSENSQKVVEILMSLAHKDGRCVIIVTHDLDIASRADIMIRMADGRIIEQIGGR